MQETHSSTLNQCGQYACFAGMRWFAAFVAIAIGIGCASGAEQHGDLRQRPRTQTTASALSPDQCIANAEIQRGSANDDSYVIQPGDQLDIDFYMSSEFNDSVSVRPDGRISLRMVGDLQAAGLTPATLSDEIDKSYQKELRSPEVAVHLKNMPSRKIYVQGEVTQPGAFPLDSRMTALQAISRAGGVTKDANNVAVLIRRDACGTPHAVKIDLAEAKKNPESEEDAALMSRDILVIPPSTIANVDNWVDHYIVRVLPVKPYFSLIPSL